MKNMRKLFAMVLSIVMVLSLATTAFAADGDPTITVPNDEHTYEIYQIFTATLTEKDGKVVLSDVKWGQNGTGYVDGAETPVDEDVLAALEDVATSSSNTEKLNVINNYVDLESAPIATLPNEGELSVAVAPGYYLIKDVDGSIANTEHDSYTTYIVEIVDSVTITRKADVPTVDKVILDSDPVDVNEAAIGEDVNYRITGTLPDNINDYKEYFYQFTDTLSKGLTYKENSMTITVNGQNVTDYFYIGVGAYDATDGTTITVAIKDLLALENLTDPAVGEITANTTVVITYTAVVNENAIINGANPNDVKLDFSNNPNDSGEGTPGTPPKKPEKPEPKHPTGETPKDTVETFVTEVHIEKVDGNCNPLTGVSFEISGSALKTVIIDTEVYTEDENGTYWKLTDGTYTTTPPTIADDETDNSADYADVSVKYSKTGERKVVTVAENVKYEAAVGEDGKLTFSGLAAGNYIIKETVTPEGYNSIADINLEVTFDPATKTFSYKWTGGATGDTNTVTVVNQAGSTLPETGGMGTTLFYLFGGVMVLAAVVLLVTKKRMAAAE